MNLFKSGMLRHLAIVMGLALSLTRGVAAAAEDEKATSWSPASILGTFWYGFADNVSFPGQGYGHNTKLFIRCGYSSGTAAYTYPALADPEDPTTPMRCESNLSLISTSGNIRTYADTTITGTPCVNGRVKLTYNYQGDPNKVLFQWIFENGALDTRGVLTMGSSGCSPLPMP